jgi:hypothetical protein
MARGMVLATTVAAFTGVARGDGKFFARDKVPADVPYQRALLLYREGSETLVLQSKYDLGQAADVNSLGWVVPVPAVPVMASVEPGIIAVDFHTASSLTRPDTVRISRLLSLAFLVAFLGGCVFLMVCLVRYPAVSKMPILKKAWGRRARNGAIITILVLLVVVTTLPGGMSRGQESIEVIKAQQVGIYDVKVIRGESGEAITGWLRENNFGFGSEDTQVLQDYGDRGWCFVAAKIQPQPGTQRREIVAEGLAAPLILEFPCDKPVYPLALTATAGSQTEILIYTLSDRKLTCGGKLKLRHAGYTIAWNVLRSVLTTAELDEWPVLRHVPPETSLMLCKFKGRLTPAQMKEDLTFDAAPDNQPRRERKIAW